MEYLVFDMCPYIMKVVFPRNIQKWFLNINFQLWPITISITQLFLVAMGVGFAMFVFQRVADASGSRVMGIVLAVPIFLIFIVVAFFEISEMNLVHFLSKMLKTYILDTPKKFQLNYARIDPQDVMIKRWRSQDNKKTIDIKENVMDDRLVKQLQKKGLLD